MDPVLRPPVVSSFRMEGFNSLNVYCVQIKYFHLIKLFALFLILTKSLLKNNWKVIGVWQHQTFYTQNDMSAKIIIQTPTMK